jgi:hypothetical protein
MTSETQGQLVFQTIPWAFLFRPSVAGHAFYVLEDKGLVVGTFVHIHEPSIHLKLHHDLSLPSKMCERKHLRSMQRMCRESAQVILDRSLFLPIQKVNSTTGALAFLASTDFIKTCNRGPICAQCNGKGWSRYACPSCAPNTFTAAMSNIVNPNSKSPQTSKSKEGVGRSGFNSANRDRTGSQT